MVKKIVALSVVAAAIFVGVTAQKRQVMLDRVVAVVGGSSILHSEVVSTAEDLTQRRREAGYTSDSDPFTEALEALLLQKLLYNQALIDSVEVNTSEVTGRVEAQVNRWVADEGSIVALEKKHHMQIYHIREMLRRRLEEQSYAQAMQNEVTSKVTITPGEVERFYKHINKDSLPTIAKQYV